MRKVASLFPNLRFLVFNLWYPWPRTNEIPEDIKIAQVKNWKLACPELISVTFIDGSTLHKRSERWILILDL